jgi:hypothetical protein
VVLAGLALVPLLTSVGGLQDRARTVPDLRLLLQTPLSSQRCPIRTTHNKFNCVAGGSSDCSGFGAMVTSSFRGVLGGGDGLPGGTCGGFSAGDTEYLDRAGHRVVPQQPSPRRRGGPRTSTAGCIGVDAETLAQRSQS